MPSVGEILAAERRRQGKSLADAVEGTKIRSRLLDALENGRYDELPNAAYVKGYVQSYARYLEIASEPLLNQFKVEYSIHAKTAVSPTDRYLNMVPANLKELPADEVVPKRERAHAIPVKVWAVVAAGSVLLVLIICGISRSCSSSTATKPLPQPTGVQQPSAAVTASPGEATTRSPAATTTVSTVQNTVKLRVTVRVGQASWLQVIVDGLKAYEGTLADGESREWLVSKSAVVKAGRPDVVTVTKDGQKVKLHFVGGNGVATILASQ